MGCTVLFSGCYNVAVEDSSQAWSLLPFLCMAGDTVGSQNKMRPFLSFRRFFGWPPPGRTEKPGQIDAGRQVKIGFTTVIFPLQNAVFTRPFLRKPLRFLYQMWGHAPLTRQNIIQWNTIPRTHCIHCLEIPGDQGTIDADRHVKIGFTTVIFPLKNTAFTRTFLPKPLRFVYQMWGHASFTEQIWFNEIHETQFPDLGLLPLKIPASHANIWLILKTADKFGASNMRFNFIIPLWFSCVMSHIWSIMNFKDCWLILSLELSF